MTHIRDRNLRKRLQKFSRFSKLKSSNVPIWSPNLWSCPNAGSLSAPLVGSTAAAAWPRIGSASTERPWHSCASPQSASCSENSAIRPEVSGQTLRHCAVRWSELVDNSGGLSESAGEHPDLAGCTLRRRG